MRYEFQKSLRLFGSSFFGYMSSENPPISWLYAGFRQSVSALPGIGIQGNLDYQSR